MMRHEEPKTRWLEAAKTVSELNTRYKQLCKKYHPDMGGDLRIMQEINAEYDARLPMMQEAEARTASADGAENTQRRTASAETAAMFREVLSKLAPFDGLTIEICGLWLWISGSTYEARDALKGAGCKWASKKRMWYWHDELSVCQSRGHGKSMEYIRAKYGSETVEDVKQARIA